MKKKLALAGLLLFAITLLMGITVFAQDYTDFYKLYKQKSNMSGTPDGGVYIKNGVIVVGHGTVSGNSIIFPKAYDQDGIPVGEGTGITKFSNKDVAAVGTVGEAGYRPAITGNVIEVLYTHSDGHESYQLITEKGDYSIASGKWKFMPIHGDEVKDEVWKEHGKGASRLHFYEIGGAPASGGEQEGNDEGGTDTRSETSPEAIAARQADYVRNNPWYSQAQQSISTINSFSAPSGSNMNLTFKDLHCISPKMADAMFAKRAYSFTVQMDYQGATYRFVIPAGFDVRTLLNEDGYAGVLFLVQELKGSRIR